MTDDERLAYCHPSDLDRVRAVLRPFGVEPKADAFCPPGSMSITGKKAWVKYVGDIVQAQLAAQMAGATNDPEKLGRSEDSILFWVHDRRGL